MAVMAAQTQKDPIQVKLVDESLYTCSSCGSVEFRVTEEDVTLHLFCQCGQIYTAKDLPPLEGS